MDEPSAILPEGLCGDLLRLLGPEPLAIDELVRQAAAGAAEVQEALAELELDDRITRHPGNRVSRARLKRPLAAVIRDRLAVDETESECDATRPGMAASARSL